MDWFLYDNDLHHERVNQFRNSRVKKSSQAAITASIFELVTQEI